MRPRLKLLLMTAGNKYIVFFLDPQPSSLAICFSISFFKQPAMLETVSALLLLLKHPPAAKRTVFCCFPEIFLVTALKCQVC